MNTKSKVGLMIAVILIILATMIGGGKPEEIKGLREEYSGLEIGLGLLFLSSFIWAPLVLVLFAPSIRL